MDTRVAKRYARALFTSALKADVVESVESDLFAIQSLFLTDEKFRSFMVNPNVARDEKIRIAGSLFSDRVTALTMRLIRLMLEKRREHELGTIYEQFVTLRRAHQDIMPVVVSSAIELTDAEKAKLTEQLIKKSGKKIEASFKIEPALIGGVRVQYGDFVLDGSVRGSLNRLSNRLKIDVLKQSVLGEETP